MLRGRVLDLGCGTGYGCHELAALDPIGEIVGIDGSPEALALARRYYPHPKITYDRGDLTHPGWGSNRGRFDAILAFEILEHLEREEAFWSGVRGVLQPGGTLWLSTPLGRGRGRPASDPYHVHQLRRSEVEALFSVGWRCSVYRAVRNMDRAVGRGAPLLYDSAEGRRSGVIDMRQTRANWKVGIIGATGAVGRTMAACLAEAGLPVCELRGFASPRSTGLELPYAGPWGSTLAVEDLREERLADLDAVLLSAGAEVSTHGSPASPRWGSGRSTTRAPSGIRGSCRAAHRAGGQSRRAPAAPAAIANPNCSTIQMVVVLAPLARTFGLRRVHVATYQSVSGRGQKGIAQLEAERLGFFRNSRRLPASDRPKCDPAVRQVAR